MKKDSALAIGLAWTLAGAALVGAAPPARAQAALCTSDGQRPPLALLERFINADCQACWSERGSERPRPGEVAIDWIVPGSRGEDAPLSAAASREAAQRLSSLGMPTPDQAATSRSPVAPPARRLRVAHGLVLNGYVGVSITLAPAGTQAWRAWLLLVEALPAGTEGSPVERLLVRGAFQPDWDAAAGARADQARLSETRTMRVPEGSRPEQLRVVGWVQDDQGRLRALAQSACHRTD